MNLIIILSYLQLITKIVTLIAFAWIAVEAVMFIGEHGLKDLTLIIWNGPGK